jgi:hypothetical protein
MPLLIALSGPMAPGCAQDGIHVKQGLADMLLEYLEARYAGEDLDGDLLYVSVWRQHMYHVRGRRLMDEYVISTAGAGLGSELDSHRTPLGLHQVEDKIGAGVPLGGVLSERRFTGEVVFGPHPGEDLITSRILWLGGLEPGINQGGLVDSHDRAIYIHGTADEASLGRPSSMGCIRMRNTDVIELFDRLPIGALVVILDN